MNRIAIVTNIPTPYREGLFARLANIQGLSFTVYYCAETFPWREWKASYEGYDYEVLKGTSFNGFALNPLIINRIARRRYDAVVIGGYSMPTALLGLFTARLSGTPILMWVESHLLDERNRTASCTKRILKQAYVANIFKIPQAFIVPGSAAKAYLEHYGVFSEDIFIAPTTVDVDWFSEKSRLSSDRKAALRKEYGVTENKIVLYVGRMIAKKGVDVLLQAYAQIQHQGHEDVGLVLIGDGPLQKKLSARSNDDGIYWLGYQPAENIPEWYGLSDLFVCPSYGDQWAVVINEAMACGLPVVASETVGAAADLIKEGVNGVTVSPGNSDALAARIVEILQASDRNDPSMMGMQSRKIISEFTHAATIKGFLEAITAVTGQSWGSESKPDDV